MNTSQITTCKTTFNLLEINNKSAGDLVNNEKLSCELVNENGFREYV